jgi:hypothetical protein
MQTAIGILLAAVTAWGSTFSDADALLGSSQTKYFQVARDQGGKWTTGHQESYYAGMLDATKPVFTATNGALAVAVRPDGGIESICAFGATAARHSDYPGGWEGWPRVTAGPLRFSISSNGSMESPADSWVLRTAYLMNAIPITEYQSKQLEVRVVAFPPISADGRQRPRAMIWGFALRNRSQAPFGGELIISAGEKLILRGAEGGRIAVSLNPGEGAWVALTATTADAAALTEVATRDSAAWLRETCSYWRRVTGQFSMAGDPFTAELFMRKTVLSLQSPAFDGRGQVAGVLYGAYPFQGADNFRDSYYAILGAVQRDPALLRPIVPWFARYAAHPGDSKFRGGVSHSLGNTLNAAMLAGLYYEATADRDFFRSDPDLVRKVSQLLEDVIATRKPDGPWLFPSLFISDGKSLGDYHTGSNVCAWRSFKMWARILDEALGDRTAAARFLKVADQIKVDLDRHNIVDGPFGQQYIEGTDADGTVPVMIHDGEETDTTLMPFYGYCARSSPAYLNFMRFAASAHNVAFRSETRGLVWEDYGPAAKVKPQGPHVVDATFPGYLTALAGCDNRQCIEGQDGYLAEIRRLTDLNGAWWWWPYGKAASRGKDLRRGPFQCGWAEGAFTPLYTSNFLGIEYDAPRREFRFSPLDGIGDFTWVDLPMGADVFTVGYHQGSVTFRNSSARPVRFRAFSLGPVNVAPGQTVRLNSGRS